MPASFLHGFEFIETALLHPIQMVRSAIIGLVGTAPAGPIQTPTLIMSRTDAAKFGAETAGFTIPQALDAIFDQGDSIGYIVVVNVLDPAVHKTPVVSESRTFGVDGRLTLAHPVVAAVVVKNTAGTVTYVSGTDYTLHAATGALTRIAAGAITAGQTVAVTYEYADPSVIVNADIIGGPDVVTGDRHGIEALLDTSSLYGFAPKILIAPQYSSAKVVMDAMLAKAATLRAVAIADSAVGATTVEAVATRNLFDNPRAILTYPLLKRPDPTTDIDQVVPYSPYLAGVISRTDNELGFWHSPSNKVILGITATERPIPHITFHSPDSLANYLNEIKLVTAIHHEGFRAWGNRSATSDTAFHFITIRRQFDIIEESVELGTIRLLDRPINRAFFEDLTDSVQLFLNSLIGRGGLIDGRVLVAPEDNPPGEIAQGRLTARLILTPVYPAERITYNVTLDIEPLKKLFA